MQRQAPVPRRDKRQVARDRDPAEQQEGQRHTQQAAVIMQRKAALDTLQRRQHENDRGGDHRPVGRQADDKCTSGHPGFEARVPPAHA